MVDQNGEIMHIIDGYRDKKREIVCLRSAIKRFKQTLASIATLLDNDATQISVYDDAVGPPRKISVERWGYNDLDFEELRTNLQTLQQALLDRAHLETQLHQAGYGDLIRDDDPPTTGGRG